MGSASSKSTIIKDPVTNRNLAGYEVEFEDTPFATGVCRKAFKGTLRCCGGFGRERILFEKNSTKEGDTCATPCVVKLYNDEYATDAKQWNFDITQTAQRLAELVSFI